MLNLLNFQNVSGTIWAAELGPILPEKCDLSDWQRLDGRPSL